MQWKAITESRLDQELLAVIQEVSMCRQYLGINPGTLELYAHSANHQAINDTVLSTACWYLLDN